MGFVYASAISKSTDLMLPLDCATPMSGFVDQVQSPATGQIAVAVWSQPRAVLLLLR